MKRREPFIEWVVRIHPFLAYLLAALIIAMMVGGSTIALELLSASYGR